MGIFDWLSEKKDKLQKGNIPQKMSIVWFTQSR